MLPIASIAIYSTDCYAVYEKNFHVNVLDSEFDSGITRGNSLKVAAFTLKELYRIHLHHVLNDEILKKYDLKTITEVIPTEIIAWALNIHTNDDKSVDYNNEENKALECLGENYRKLNEYNQSNFNYVLLINLLDSCIGGAGDYESLAKNAREKLDAVTEDNNKKYEKYKSYLDKAENDLKQYFDDLKLFDFINQIKMRANVYFKKDYGYDDKIVRQMKREMNPSSTRPLALVSEINLKLDDYTEMRTKLSGRAGENSMKLNIEEIYENNSIYNESANTMTTTIKMTYPQTFDDQQRVFLGYIPNETNVDPENLTISKSNTSRKEDPNLETKLAGQMDRFNTVTTEMRDRLTTINQQRDLIFVIEDDGEAKQMLLLSDILNIQPNKKDVETSWFRYYLIKEIMDYMWKRLEDLAQKRKQYYNETTEEALEKQLPHELAVVEVSLASLK